jgi:hypothetical protein
MPDRSSNKDAQVILHKIQRGGVHYIESVSGSFETAKLGFAFAKRALDLCNDLSSPECSDELIRDSIAEMRGIAQNAHTGARATTKNFDANRREFTEVRRSHTDKSRNNTISVDSNQDLRDSQIYQD